MKYPLPNKDIPRLIKFDSIGSSQLGFISVGQEFEKIPFEIKRVYWTYFTPQNVNRGGHANRGKELVLVAVAGIIHVNVELIDGSTYDFELNNPDMGLYIPKLAWHKMRYSHNAVQMVLASNHYSEDDYIRDYTVFKTLNDEPEH